MLCNAFYNIAYSVTDLDVNSSCVTVRSVGINDVKKPVQVEVCFVTAVVATKTATATTTAQ